MSDIRANTISDESGNGPINLHKQNAAKACAMYDQIALKIHMSLNVSTITDDATGMYTHNYTSGFSKPEFRERVYAGMGPGARVVQFTGSSTVSSTQFRVANSTTDADWNTNSSVIVHGDLA